MAALRVLGFDHLVLRCRDVGTTLAWYVDRLGLEPVRVDEWRAGEVLFPSARVDTTTIIDFLPLPDPSFGLDTFDTHLDHLCLVVDADSLDRVLVDPSFVVVDGPGERFGAQGVATSVYVRDPDGLVVEFRAYPSA